MEIKTIKRSEIKTYEDVILNDPYLASIYIELSKITNQFHCLEDFVSQISYIRGLVIPLVKENKTPDTVINTIKDNLALLFNYKATSLEYYFHSFLLSEFLLNHFKEAEQSSKHPKAIATLLQSKLEVIFYEGIKQFPFEFETDRDNIKVIRNNETKGVQGVNFKWWVYSKGAKESKPIDTNKQPQKLIKPIWWQGTGRQLGYLLDELAAKGFIDKNTNFNEAIKIHFIDKEQKPFTDSIKQNKSGASNTNKNGKPKGANVVDEIIKDLPNNQ